MARRPVAFCLAVRSSDKHDISRFTVLQSLTQHRPFDADFIRMRPVSTRACARALYLWQHLVRTPTFPMPCPGAHGWYPRGAPQSQLAPGQALRTPRLQALPRWRGRACSGTPAAAPRAGRRVFRWLLPGQGPRARRPARVGGAPSATLGVGVPRNRGQLRRGGLRNPITAPRAGRASQGCSAGAGTAGLRAPLPPRPPSGRLPEAAAGQHGPPGAQRPPRGARPDSPRRGLRCGGRGTRRRRGSPERRLRRALPSPSVDTTCSARPLARRRGEERDEREPGAGRRASRTAPAGGAGRARAGGGAAGRNLCACAGLSRARAPVGWLPAQRPSPPPPPPPRPPAPPSPPPPPPCPRPRLAASGPRPGLPVRPRSMQPQHLRRRSRRRL